MSFWKKEDWFEKFHSTIKDEEYRYKKNIREFVRNFDEHALLTMLLMASPTLQQAVERAYNDYEKGTPPDEAAKHVIDILHQTKRQ